MEEEPKNKFYAHGKFFETEEEFFKFCSEWDDSDFDLEEFKHQMYLRIQEAEMNLMVRGGKMSNRTAYKILRLSTDWAAGEPKCGYINKTYDIEEI